MTVGLRLAPKLTALFVLFAALALGGLGGFAYLNGRSALIESTTSGLLSTAIEKEAALDTWANERRRDIARIAAMDDIRVNLALFALSPPNSPIRRRARRRLLGLLDIWVGETGEFQSLFIVEPDESEVVVSTAAGDAGTFKENRAYLVEGRNGRFLEGPYYSITVQAPTVVASAPIRSFDGKLLGVLAGRMKMSELNGIIARRTGLYETDDAYLVNASHLLVTQPRLVDDPSVLQRGIYTPVIERCRTGQGGSAVARDFRGVPVIAVYRWLAQRRLCLVVKVGQAEAFESVRNLGKAILASAAGVLLAAMLLAMALARTITRPVRTLRDGAAAVGRGDLAVRLPEHARDELGQLAHEFNNMTAALEGRTEALWRSQAQYRSLFENAQVMMHVVDRDLRLTRVNDTWLKTLGYERHEAIGFAVLNFMTAESAELAKSVAMPRLAQHGRISDIPYTFVGKNGQRIDVLLSAFAELDDRGEMDRAIGVLVDVTQRKRAEEALKKLNEDLEGRVEGRTAELRAAQSELVRNERLAALGQLTGSVAHELRNPLGAMRASIAAIKRLADGASPMLQSSVEIVDRSIGRCDAIISDLLGYSRVKGLDRGSTAIDGWLGAILDEYAVPAGVTLRRDLAPGIEAAIDRHRLRRALVNLLDNACQAMTGEGGEADAGEGAARILTVGARASGDSLEISVADTGPGIPEDERAAIFEPLYSTRNFGVGLGLTLVRQIAEQHGGGVEVEGGPGQGARFTLRLPLRETKRSAA